MKEEVIIQKYLVTSSVVDLRPILILVVFVIIVFYFFSLLLVLVSANTQNIIHPNLKRSLAHHCNDAEKL